jgi:hypothetical protein
MHRYETNPNVIHETIQGETIIIDLATGTYYSLLGSGPLIWDEVTSGATSSTVLARAVERFDAEPAEIEDAVEAFIGQLEEAGLIARSSETDGDAPGLDATPAEKIAFAAPRLETYTDMQDIILLDPVHKVDSRGWPHPADAATG